MRVCALGQRLRHFADYLVTTAVTANGARVRRWFQENKPGWYAVLADPQMPVTSTLLEQTHNAIEWNVMILATKPMGVPLRVCEVDEWCKPFYRSSLITPRFSMLSVVSGLGCTSVTRGSICPGRCSRGRRHCACSRRCA